MNIYISEEIKALVPSTALGIIKYTAIVDKSCAEQLKDFDEKINELEKNIPVSAIAELPHVASTRKAYKSLGKSPTEYRNAAEAMLRRIAKGQGLYHINNVVEVNNLISVSSGYSIGSYDTDGLKGKIELRHAEDGAHYDGIGKGSVNIGRLPVLYDELGAVGNPTSDSRRAMITEGRHEIISVIYSFDGKKELEELLDKFAGLLRQYCNAESIEISIIE